MLSAQYRARNQCANSEVSALRGRVEREAGAAACISAVGDASIRVDSNQRSLFHIVGDCCALGGGHSENVALGIGNRGASIGSRTVGFSRAI